MNAAREPLFPAWNNLPALAPGQVQVFGLRVDVEPGLIARAGLLLSPAERERAERILIGTARDEFVLGRAALRFLTGAVLGVEPTEVRIEVEAFGKPSVPGVQSNVTHSRGLIYVALCRDKPVGIDVEWIDASLEALELAEANFSPEEAAWIAAQPRGVERARLFCGLWTRKEAVAKACGLGLRLPLQKIVVPRSVTGRAWIEQEIAANSDMPVQHPMFYVQKLPAPDGFALSLAVEGDTALPISCRDFHG